MTDRSDEPEVLVQHMERQTKALERIDLMLLVWTVLAVLAVVTWVFISLAG